MRRYSGLTLNGLVHMEIKFVETDSYWAMIVKRFFTMQTTYREADKAIAETTIWSQSRKYNSRQIHKILATHMMNHRRPPYIMWPASISSICLRLYFLLWPHIVLYIWTGWHYKSMFLSAIQFSGALFENVFSRRAGNRTSPNAGNPEMFGSCRLYKGF